MSLLYANLNTDITICIQRITNTSTQQRYNSNGILSRHISKLHATPIQLTTLQEATKQQNKQLNKAEKHQTS